MFWPICEKVFEEVVEVQKRDINKIFLMANILREEKNHEQQLKTLTRAILFDVNR